MEIHDPHGTLKLRPEQMTTAELRQHLEPYGTKYRYSMSKRQLVETILGFQENLRRYGNVSRPFGTFEDNS